MKILITWSSGFIGSELSNELKEDHEIVTYDICED
jgi:nucleoside-diphosphate-sugar epimerase